MIENLEGEVWKQCDFGFEDETTKGEFEDFKISNKLRISFNDEVVKLTEIGRYWVAPHQFPYDTVENYMKTLCRINYPYMSGGEFIVLYNDNVTEANK